MIWLSGENRRYNHQSKGKDRPWGDRERDKGVQAEDKEGELWENGPLIIQDSNYGKGYKVPYCHAEEGLVGNWKECRYGDWGIWKLRLQQLLERSLRNYVLPLFLIRFKL